MARPFKFHSVLSIIKDSIYDNMAAQASKSLALFLEVRDLAVASWSSSSHVFDKSSYHTDGGFAFSSAYSMACVCSYLRKPTPKVCDITIHEHIDPAWLAYAAWAVANYCTIINMITEYMRLIQIIRIYGLGDPRGLRILLSPVRTCKWPDSCHDARDQPSTDAARCGAGSLR